MSYIPAPNNDFLPWAINFVETLEADPAAFGFSPAEVAQLRVELDSFEALLDLTNSPSTRTSTNIADRISQRQVLEPMCRVFAQRIQSNPSTTNGQRETLGITVPSGVAPPVAVNLTPPEIVAVNSGGMLKVTYQNPDTPDSKAKPHGATGMQIVLGRRNTIDGPIPTPAECEVVGVISRTPQSLNVEALNLAGQFTTVYGRWTYSDSRQGTWSAPSHQAFV